MSPSTQTPSDVEAVATEPSTAVLTSQPQNKEVCLRDISLCLHCSFMAAFLFSLLFLVFGNSTCNKLTLKQTAYASYQVR